MLHLNVLHRVRGFCFSHPIRPRAARPPGEEVAILVVARVTYGTPAAMWLAVRTTELESESRTRSDSRAGELTRLAHEMLGHRLTGVMP